MIDLKKIEKSVKFKTPSPLTKEEKEKIKKKEEQAKREAKKEEKKEKELQFLLAQMKLDDVISNIKDKRSREYIDSDFPIKIDFSIPQKDIKRLEIDKDFRILQINEDSFYIYPKVIEDVFLTYLKNAINIFLNTDGKLKWDIALKNFWSSCLKMLTFLFIYCLSCLWILLYCGSIIEYSTNEVVSGFTVAVVCFVLFSLPVIEFLIFQHYSEEKKSKFLLLEHILNSYFYPITIIIFFVKNCITLRNCKKKIQKEKENRGLRLKESPFYFDELLGAKKYTVII